MKVVAKDDCFTAFVAMMAVKRGIAFNLLAREEKVHSQILVDALDGLVPDPAVVRPLVTAPYALPFVLERKSLGVRGADLIIIGSFSDLTIKLYRHRVEGWRFFELHDRLDPARTRLLFEREDLVPVEVSMRNTLALFEHYEKQSPDAVKVWINYPFVGGDVLSWDGPIAREHREALQRARMGERFAEFTAASHDVLAPTGVRIIDTPPGMARPRDGNAPWHYQDEVYDLAAQRIAALVMGE